MKTIKKITAILLSTLMLISALPLSGISANSASEEIVTAVDSTEIDSTEGETDTSTEDVKIIASGACGPNANWTYDSECTLTISGEGGMNDFSSSLYPSAIPWDTYKYNIKNVVIEEGITQISSFGYFTDLTSIDLPSTIEEISASTFFFCDSLTEIIIPEKVTKLENMTFAYCASLKEVKLSENITTIDDRAFYMCDKIETIYIPDSVTSIGTEAFLCCNSLKIVCNKGSYAESFAIENSIPYEYSEMIIASGECGTNVTWALNDKGTLIISGEGKMYTYSNTSFAPWNTDELSVNNAIIENGITEIAPYSFYNCTELQSVTIPESVTGIGSAAFMGCIGLTEVTIPKNVTSIGSFAFRDCTGLTDVSISESVTELGSYSFYGCTGLTSIIIPESVTSIGSDAFRNCSNLISATLPDNLTSIPSFMFYSCQSLTSIKIPDSVTSIGRSAFECCYSLESVNIPEGVTILDIGVFMYCTSLTDITIPDSVTSIEQSALSCSALTNIIIPDSVISIGDSAFSGCDRVTNIVIPDSVTSFGESVFSGCEKLTSVTLPNNITSLKDNLFYYCSNLTTVTIPESVTSIGNHVFADCTSLTDISIPATVTSIGESAFENCNILIYCYKNSYAEAYAIENNLNYELIKPYITSDGVVLTIHGLEGVKDFLIAKGDYSTYREVKDNLIVLVTNAKFGDADEYTYWLSDYGLYTVYIRYTDSSKAPAVLKTELSGPIPELSANGLQLNLSNLEGVKVIRTAYGDYDTAGDIKRAEGQRSVSASKITSDTYTFQYRENGLVSVAVVYESGYTHIFKHEICKYVPEFVQEGNTVTISDLDNLRVIRYAPGEYSTSSEIKRAEGCVNITPAKLNDGMACITLEPGVYTFCVQYVDDSYNYYVVTVA